MNIFKPTTFMWWQLGMMKWAVLCIGIAIGASWADVFAPYKLILTVVGLLLSLCLGIMWTRGK